MREATGAMVNLQRKNELRERADPGGVVLGGRGRVPCTSVLPHEQYMYVHHQLAQKADGAQD